MNTPGTPEKKIAAQTQRAQKLRQSLVALKDLKDIKMVVLCLLLGYTKSYLG